MTITEMTTAELKVKQTILQMIKKYNMEDEELEAFYHRLALDLLSPCVTWSREKWLNKK